MMTSTAALPLSLRRESFGGILFDPLDATFLELDEEAFAVLARFAHDGMRPEDASAAHFLTEVGETIAGLDGRPFRLVGEEKPIRGAPVPVLSAPTLVDFQITNKCYLDCPHCYADSTAAGAHATMEDIELALDQIAEVGVFQLAIGGGEPLLHPRIGDILARCHELGIVPNLTTSGLNLNERNLALLARYCGAVGVSLEGVGEDFASYRKTGFPRFEQILAKFREYGIPTVLQVALNVEIFSRLEAITEYCMRQEDLYGVIFLAFKPVGRGAGFGETLASLPHRQVHEGLQAALETLTQATRVGFDCCLTPGVTDIDAGYESNAAEYLEGCSALRTSIGLSPTLDVMPCTFTAEHAVGNLKEHHLRDIWHGVTTATWHQNMAGRAKANDMCGSCPKYSYCLGGCPVMNLVNCGRDYLSVARPHAHPGQDGHAFSGDNRPSQHASAAL